MLDKLKQFDRTRLVLGTIIVATIPCYCLGMLLLWNVNLAHSQMTPSPTLTPEGTLQGSITPTFTLPAFTRTVTLTPTITTTFTPTITYMLPPTLTHSPSPSPSPTNPPVPSPTITDTPVPLPSLTPTESSTITLTPSDTP
jgi:hypothetical protein